MSDRDRVTPRWYDRIAFKTAVSVVLLVSASILFAAFRTLNEEARHTEQELMKSGIFLANAVARQAALPLRQGDQAALQNLIDAFDAGSGTPSTASIVSYSEILDGKGAVVAQAGAIEDAGRLDPLLPSTGTGGGSVLHRIDPAHVEIHAPIVHAGDTIGFLRLGITQEHRYELLDAVRGRTLRTAGILSIVAILAGGLFGRRFVRPLTLLARSAQKIGEQQWGQTVPIQGSDEIGQLARTFNEMSAKLQRSFAESQQATQRLIQADKFAALGTLSATLAHELRNPLTAVKMILEAATEQGQQVDCTRQDLEVMLQEVRRMEGTVTEILGLAGPHRVDVGLQDLNGVVRGLFTLIRHRLEIAGIQTTLALDERIPVFSFDSKRIEQLFFNLIVNAVEAMPQGGELELRTEWSPATGQVRIAVRDRGVGIPSSIRSRIFDPFFTTKGEGTGIGLSVVYTVVRDHGGEIEVESEEGVGSTFLITLPVKGEPAHAPHPDRG